MHEYACFLAHMHEYACSVSVMKKICFLVKQKKVIVIFESVITCFKKYKFLYDIMVVMN